VYISRCTAAEELDQGDAGDGEGRTHLQRPVYRASTGRPRNHSSRKGSSVYLNTCSDLREFLDNGGVLDGEEISGLGEILGLQHLAEQAPHPPQLLQKQLLTLYLARVATKISQYEILQNFAKISLREIS